MAKERLAVEAALQRIEALLVARLGSRGKCRRRRRTAPLMRRLIALVLVAAAVAGAAFFAEHPGHVTIIWQGWQVDTSVGVLVGAVALVVLVVSLLVLLAAALRRVPGNLRRRRAARRHRAGEAALTRGVVALAAGQPAQAQLAARRAATLLDGAPMALLLVAEAATRQGDTPAARDAYTALLERPETAFLGLRGLIGQALRAGDDGTARHLAERARKLRPDAVWLVDALLVLEARAGDWAAARADARLSGPAPGVAGRARAPSPRRRALRDEPPGRAPRRPAPGGGAGGQGAGAGGRPRRPGRP